MTDMTDTAYMWKLQQINILISFLPYVCECVCVFLYDKVMCLKY